MRLHFYGATRQVTGSCMLLEAGGRRVLIDCGLIQGGGKQEARNREPFPFDPTTLDAVVLTHAHLDHSGRLPLLVRSGYDGPIHTHTAGAALVDILLRDAAFLAERDAAIENKKRRRRHDEPVEPTYTVADAEQTIEALVGHAYDEPWQPVPGVTVRLRDAGHILGSAIVEMWIEADGERRKVVFSGDLGHAGAPILRNPTEVGEADLLVMESTYGDRDHRSWEETWEELGEIIRNARASHGNILVPAFAVGRTQELLYILARHYEAWELGDWSVFLDSPMAIEATKVYARFPELYDAETAAFYAEPDHHRFQLPNLRLTPQAEDSMAINRVQSGALIIAGSGMCNGGRIRHHFKHNLWRRNCNVIMVGFQAQGTPGRALVDGASELNLWGESVRVGAKVHTVGGLSAHAGRSELIAWAEHFATAPRVALVHGEAGAMDSLAEALRGRGLEVETPEEGASIDLRQLPARSAEPPEAS
ncbi:MBL fold metallo-hydrolase RNA specificity domain-containing protein [Halorhodospira halophila]|uniref:Beta-lactamase domain protein n=1 Tax=Halorhodospira halophila (strain DSM 244 / SL1) TaxID=349124 RepID=A1WV92_HALHL|nr:MBL fold metallo-hydrolase [Halorhodospira halophila]ABM61604.1 beta-lactamase domain protein [Halorhodospira halophila SL1]MBK1729938.1 MBL fold hydrolase [Halorhodospira halophila]